ncbi:hypothetical protein V8C35DRAFT_220660 [Trichoderma chlorosporum]
MDGQVVLRIVQPSISPPSAQRPIAKLELSSTACQKLAAASVDGCSALAGTSKLRGRLRGGQVTCCARTMAEGLHCGLAASPRKPESESILIRLQCCLLSFALSFWEDLDPSSHITVPGSSHSNPSMYGLYEYVRASCTVLRREIDVLVQVEYEYAEHQVRNDGSLAARPRPLGPRICRPGLNWDPSWLLAHSSSPTNGFSDHLTASFSRLVRRWYVRLLAHDLLLTNSVPILQATPPRVWHPVPSTVQ